MEQLIPKQSAVTTFFFLILCIFYAVGVFFHLYEPTFNAMKQLTPYVLAAHALIVFGQLYISAPITTQRTAQRTMQRTAPRTGQEKKWIGIWLLVAYPITMLIEILALRTGAIFGAYTYGTTLGAQILGVPIIIGLNWCLVMFSVFETLRMARVSLVVGILAGSFLVLLFDVILEPFAIGRLDYWQWEGGHVPAQNYFAWFVIAFVFSVLYCWLVPYPSQADELQESQTEKMRDSQVRQSLRPLERIHRFSNAYFPLLMLCLQTLFIIAIQIGFMIGQ